MGSERENVYFKYIPLFIFERLIKKTQFELLIYDLLPLSKEENLYNLYLLIRFEWNFMFCILANWVGFVV